MLDTITVRRMPFEFPNEIDPVFVEDDHELSFAFIAASLLLPHLEPYLIRSMKAAQRHVTDPKVLEGLKAFAAQEGQHYRMHMKFNETIRRSGFPGLDALEKELSDDYHRFSKTKSLRFNLAYAEGFEAVTMHVVKRLMEPNGFGEDLPMFLQMWEWHFVEELEHRTVAFDVYDHVCGGYFYRLVVGASAAEAQRGGEGREGGAEEDIPNAPTRQRPRSVSGAAPHLLAELHPPRCRDRTGDPGSR
jgi:predicted metal-dependent hydrolase